MVIDGHTHACGQFLTPEGIIEVLDGCGVAPEEKQAILGNNMSRLLKL